MKALARGIVVLAALAVWTGCGDDNGSTQCADGSCETGDSDTVATPTIVAVSASTNAVTVGQTVENVTVTLDQAPATDITIGLVVTFGSVNPTSVTVAAGSKTSSAFTYTAPSTPTTDTITATYGRSVASMTVTVAPVAPPPLGLAGVTVGVVDSTHLAGETPVNTQTTGIVTLTAEAKTDLTVQLSLDEPDGDVGSLDQTSVVITAGTNSATFGFTTGPTPGSGTVTATVAGLDPSSKSGPVTVIAAQSPD